MTKELDEETKKNLEVLQSLNKAIEEGPWVHSTFFKAIGKKLMDMRDKFRDDLHLAQYEDGGVEASEAVDANLQYSEDMMPVYLMLYNTDGHKLEKWEATINSLYGHSVNRPVYSDESYARSALRAAANKYNQSYLIIHIDKLKIMQLAEDKIPKDRWGNELVSLNDNAVMIENIKQFIHPSGRYEVKKGKLLKISEIDFV